MPENNVKQVEEEKKKSEETKTEIKPAPATKLQLCEDKLKAVRKELTKLRKENKELTAKLEAEEKKSALYFNESKGASAELVQLKSKMSVALDMTGDAMNMSIKNLRQAFGLLAE